MDSPGSGLQGEGESDLGGLGGAVVSRSSLASEEVRIERSGSERDGIAAIAGSGSNPCPHPTRPGQLGPALPNFKLTSAALPAIFSRLSPDFTLLSRPDCFVRFL